MSATSYYVDEAGDTTLFSRYGKALVGTEVVSAYFMVGRLEVADVDALQVDLDALRRELLSDPLLQAIPSMQAGAAKTALFFHAKDDVPEVRHAVFKVLLRHEIKISAVVKSKQHLLNDLQVLQKTHPHYRYKAQGHDVYDALISRLFATSSWEVESKPSITFAVRGNKARTAILQSVFEETAMAQARDMGFSLDASFHSTYPSKSAGLQACDYLLWALQRFYERHEERFIQAMWSKFDLVLDMSCANGTIFNEKHPLSLKSRAGV
jgi:hypothetical protein